MTQTESEKAAQEISHAINVCGNNPKVIAQYLANEHPTLQQSFMNVACYFIVCMAREGKYTDLRNQCATDKAKRIVAHMEYEDKEGLCPFI